MDINGISKQKSMVAEGERGTRIAKSVCWLVRPLRGWVGEQREERKHSSPPSPFPQPPPPLLSSSAMGVDLRKILRLLRSGHGRSGKNETTFHGF